MKHQWVLGLGMLFFGSLIISTQMRKMHEGNLRSKLTQLVSAARNAGTVRGGRLAAVGFGAIFLGLVSLMQELLFAVEAVLRR